MRRLEPTILMFGVGIVRSANVASLPCWKSCSPVAQYGHPFSPPLAPPRALTLASWFPFKILAHAESARRAGPMASVRRARSTCRRTRLRQRRARTRQQARQPEPGSRGRARQEGARTASSSSSSLARGTRETLVVPAQHDRHFPAVPEDCRIAGSRPSILPPLIRRHANTQHADNESVAGRSSEHCRSDCTRREHQTPWTTSHRRQGSAAYN
jgi:hypothetical protein